MEIKFIKNSNVLTLTICALCEKPQINVYEITDDGKSLCLCRDCLNRFSNYVIKMYLDNKEKNDLLSLRIDEVFGTYIYHCLARGNFGACSEYEPIDTIGQLVNLTERKLKRCRNLGKKSIETIKNWLKEHGLSLKTID